MARRTLSPEEMQKLAIPTASENKAGEAHGNPGAVTPNTREQIMKDIQAKAGEGINMGRTSPHATNGINPNAPGVKENPHFQEMLKGADAPVPVEALETDFPPPAMGAPSENFDPLAPFEEELAPGLHVSRKGNTPTYRPPAQPAKPEPCKRCGFLDQDLKMVTLELTDGTFVIKAHSVVETKLSLAVMVPTDSAHFIPKPGTEIEVRVGERAWDCYFPGTYATYEDMGVMILVFVKRDPE